MRTMGSPPEKMYIKVPSSLPCWMMLSMVSRLMFSLLPYSAAQQPVQCRLQAEVGSIKMAQGMLQLYWAMAFSWRPKPMREVFTRKFSKNVLRTSGSRSVHRLIMSVYQLLSGFSKILWNTRRWLGRVLSLSNLSAQSSSLGRLFSGFSSK